MRTCDRSNWETAEAASSVALRRDVDSRDVRQRCGNRLALSLEKLDVTGDRFLYQALRLFECLANGEAAGQIGHRGAVAVLSALDDDSVFHGRLPFQSSPA